MSSENTKQLQHCDYGDMVVLHGDIYLVGHKVKYKNARNLTFYNGTTREESMNTTVVVQHDVDNTLWNAYLATKGERRAKEG